MVTQASDHWAGGPHQFQLGSQPDALSISIANRHVRNRTRLLKLNLPCLQFMFLLALLPLG